MVDHMHASELEINPTESSIATSEKVITMAKSRKKPKLRVVVKGKFSSLQMWYPLNLTFKEDSIHVWFIYPKVTFK